MGGSETEEKLVVSVVSNEDEVMLASTASAYEPSAKMPSPSLSASGEPDVDIVSGSNLQVSTSRPEGSSYRVVDGCKSEYGSESWL